jgi:hypothetical protein
MSSRWYSNQTQIQWACRELLQGKSISHASEFVAVHGWRLAAIIHQLRHRYGWPILTTFEGKNRIGHYSLNKEKREKWPKLKKPPSFFESAAEYQEHLKDFDIPPAPQG